MRKRDNNFERNIKISHNNSALFLGHIQSTSNLFARMPDSYLQHVKVSYIIYSVSYQWSAKLT